MALTKFDILNELWEKLQHTYPYNIPSKDDSRNEELKKDLQWHEVEFETVLNKELQDKDRFNVFNWPFNRLYKALGFNKALDEYKKAFFERIKNSPDKERMIDLEIKTFEIADLNYNVALRREKDRIPELIKQGFSLAIKAENPTVGDILFKPKRQLFTYKGLYSTEDLYGAIFKDIGETSFIIRWDGLKFTCNGYLRAQKVCFLKDFKTSYLQEEETKKLEKNAVDLPMHKQQIKLNWTGQKNQLYSVLRQLKERNYISNTYDELVDFIHDNVIGFENDKKETTRGALKKNMTLPKPKRINLDLDDEE